MYNNVVLSAVNLAWYVTTDNIERTHKLWSLSEVLNTISVGSYPVYEA